MSSERPMSLLKFAFLIGISFFATAAAAQTVGAASELRQDAPVRVQTSFNFFVPGPTGDSEEAQKLRDNARRSIYEMAAHECAMLREILAKDGRMQSISTNIGRQQFGPQQQDGFSVNGSMDLQIILK
jgi:hypothetical protein